VRTVKSRLYSEDVQVMARSLPKLQMEEAELLAGVITRELTKSLWEMAIELLQLCGVLRKKNDEVDRESLKTPEQEEQEALRRANALVRSMAANRPRK